MIALSHVRRARKLFGRRIAADPEELRAGPRPISLAARNALTIISLTQPDTTPHHEAIQAMRKHLTALARIEFAYAEIVAAAAEQQLLDLVPTAGELAPPPAGRRH